MGVVNSQTWPMSKKAGHPTKWPEKTLPAYIHYIHCTCTCTCSHHAWWGSNFGELKPHQKGEGLPNYSLGQWPIHQIHVVIQLATNLGCMLSMPYVCSSWDSIVSRDAGNRKSFSSLGNEAG